MQQKEIQALVSELEELRESELTVFFEEAEALVRGYYDTAFFMEYWLGLKLTPFQRRACAVIDDLDRQGKPIYVISPAGNQSGKTVLIACIHIKWNFYKKGGLKLDELTFKQTFYQTLNLSPVKKQAQVCAQYVEDILKSKFSWQDNNQTYLNHCRIRNFFKGKNVNEGRIDFANNSMFFCVSTGEDQAANIQGAQFGGITYDESVLSQHLQSELPSKILSRIAKYGRLLFLIGSPKREKRQNSRQYFYHLVQDAKKGLNEFVHVTGNYIENQFIPEKQRDMFVKSVQSLDPLAYREAIFGDFVKSADQMFSPDIIEAMWNSKEGASDPIDEHEYVFIVDWGFADGGDKSIFGGFDITNHPDDYEVIYHYTVEGGDPWALMAQLQLLLSTYNDARLLMDTNALGGVILKKMLKDLHPIGFDSHGKEKQKALEALLLLLTEPHKCGITNVGRIKSYHIAALEEEMASYRLDDTKLVQDWVMVLAMFSYFVKHRLPKPKDKNEKPLNLSMQSRFQSMRSSVGQSNA